MYRDTESLHAEVMPLRQSPYFIPILTDFEEMWYRKSILKSLKRLKFEI
jgi:hypothetical protein